GVANRENADPGERAAGHPVCARHHLPTAASEGADQPGQQHIQRLAVRRGLVRTVDLHGEDNDMLRHLPGFALAAAMVLALGIGGPAMAQKSSGTLRLSHFDSPASMSILEEATRAALQPALGVFNNLV